MWLTLVGAFACSPAGPSGTGTLNVRITDSPFSEAKAVLVTFSEVSVHRDGSGWQPVPFAGAAVTSRTCDLKKLEQARRRSFSTSSAISRFLRRGTAATS